MDQKKQTGEDLKFEQISSSSSNVVAVSQQQQQQQQVVKPKVKPAVPPKPPLDAYRYSMVNMEGKNANFCPFRLYFVSI